MQYRSQTAIRRPDCEWAKLYQRLVPLKCGFNEKTRQYTGRAKVMGRIAGQMIATIFALLKQDAETLSRLPVGAPLPEPTRYDPALHQQHRTGRYRASAPEKRAQMLEFVPR